METMSSERKGLGVVGDGEKICGQDLDFQFIGLVQYPNHRAEPNSLVIQKAVLGE